jgi:hypothetical protein
MKRIIIAFLTTFILLASCTKEPAIEPNAQFSINLVDNTTYTGETFYIYLDNCTGDHFTLYRGWTPGTSWNPDTATTGTPLDRNTDSVANTYVNPGEFPLTLVASSSGNWGEEFLVDVYTVHITVLEP